MFNQILIRNLLGKIISKIFIIVTAYCLLHYPLSAQNDTVVLPKRTTMKTPVEIIGINVGVWAVNRYVIANDEVYNININTMKRNLQHGFVWDNDQFSTNLLGHPYHGGLYFNAARTNGMNFWQSTPYTVAGSLMWEYFMETEPPSINDFIATSMGGVALGEITFRLSDLLVDNRATGWNRFGHELLSALISPMSGLNRIFSGEAWKVRHSGSEFSADIPVNFYIAAGHRVLVEDSEVRSKLDNGLYVEARLYYGNLFSEDNEKPYDAFLVRTSFNFFSEQPVIGNVNLIGHLWGQNISLKSEKSTLHCGFFQHFDYYNSNTVIGAQRVSSYRIAETAAIGAGGQFKITWKKNKTFVSSAYLTGILLGGSITDYYRVINRDYNLGSGFSSKFSAGLLGRKAGLHINVEDYRLFTWKGYDPAADLSRLTADEQHNLNAQGDKGHVRFTICNLNFYYHFLKHGMLSLEISYYIRNSYYKYFPNVAYQMAESKVGIGYLL
jgi:hypothetical protein